MVPGRAAARADHGLLSDWPKIQGRDSATWPNAVLASELAGFLALNLKLSPLQPGKSPLDLGPKLEEAGKKNTSLARKVTFPFRLLLGSTAGA